MKFDANIKLDISVAVNIAVTIMMIWTLNNSGHTVAVVEDVKDDTQKVDKKLTTTDNKITKAVDRINHFENASRLTDKQYISLLFQILREVR